MLPRQFDHPFEMIGPQRLAHVLALGALGAGVKRAYNVGIGRGYSVREVIRVVEEVTGRRVAVKEGPRRAGDPPELVARHLPDAKVVKAFNTMNWKHIRDLARPEGDPERLAIPIAADDEAAKRTVFELVDEIGFDPVDGGTLHESKRQEPGAAVYGADLHADAARDALASAA